MGTSSTPRKQRKLSPKPAVSGFKFVPKPPKPPREVIYCSIEETDLDGDYSTVEGVVTTCPKCGHRTESFGTGPKSYQRNFYLMAEECPLKGEDGLVDGVRHCYVGGGD